jgi:hypothetical protein
VAELLEILCWCAALATWLILLRGFVGEAIGPLAKSIRRLWIEIGLKAKGK